MNSKADVSGQHIHAAQDGLSPLSSDDDPMLRELARLRNVYLDLSAARERELAAVTNTAAQQGQRVARLERDLSALQVSLAERDRAVQAAEARAAAMTAQAQQLADHLKHIYSAFFRGGVFGLILKACIELTGAQKGLYLWQVPGPTRRFKVKDAVGFQKYPGAEPSPFIHHLVAQVFESNDAFLAADRAAFDGFPPPDAEENFANCIVVPVVIQDKLNGVIIVADKQAATFTQEDCRTLLSIGSHASVALQNLKLQTELRQTHVTTIAVLADAVELKDAYTHGHCQQVARFARQVAADLGMDDEEQQRVYYAALLHDVGKIGVADMVLLKAGPLSPEEMSMARAHVRLGYDLITQVPWLLDVAQLVLYHHERWDGAGYPEGVAGEDIPLGSRIVGAVDTYCTMITRRPYQAVRSQEDALAEIQRVSGSQLDPQVVEALIRVVNMPEAELDESEAEFMNVYGVDEDKPDADK